jgi:hypothetical protein
VLKQDAAKAECRPPEQRQSTETWKGGCGTGGGRAGAKRGTPLLRDGKQQPEAGVASLERQKSEVKANLRELQSAQRTDTKSTASQSNSKTAASRPERVRVVQTDRGRAGATPGVGRRKNQVSTRSSDRVAWSAARCRHTSGGQTAALEQRRREVVPQRDACAVNRGSGSRSRAMFESTDVAVTGEREPIL